MYAEAGGVTPARVVALHGWGRRGADFLPALSDLDYLAFDLPGFGASPLPAEAMGAAGTAALLAPLIAESAQRPVLVGHSYGGRVAVALAASGAVEVRGLVLTGVPLLRLQAQQATPIRYRWGRWAHRRGLISGAKMEALRQRYGSADYRLASGVMRETLVKVVNESYEAELMRLSAPVRLLWGVADTEVPVGVAERAAAILSQRGIDARLEVVEGASHWLPTEAPATLRRTVDDLLAAP